MSNTELTRLEGAKLVELLEAQNALNIKYVGTDWKDKVQVTSILTAIDTEVSEFLESSSRLVDNKNEINHGWKWWKKTIQNDEQNQVVETIDVLHFCLTLLLKTHGINETMKINKKIDKLNINLETPINDILVAKSKLILSSLEGDKIEVLHLIYELLYAMSISSNRTLEDIYNGYFKKNELNHKRIENGYIEGQYNKIDENGQEDNKKLDV